MNTQGKQIEKGVGAFEFKMMEYVSANTSNKERSEVATTQINPVSTEKKELEVNPFIGLALGHTLLGEITNKVECETSFGRTSQEGEGSAKEMDEIIEELESILNNLKQKKICNVDTTILNSLCPLVDETDLKQQFKQLETIYDRVYEAKLRFDENSKTIKSIQSDLKKIISLELKLKVVEIDNFENAKRVDMEMSRIVAEMKNVNNLIRTQKIKEIEVEDEKKKMDFSTIEVIPCVDPMSGSLSFEGIILGSENFSMTEETNPRNCYKTMKRRLGIKPKSLLFNSEWNGFDGKLFCSNLKGVENVLIIVRKGAKEEFFFVKSMPKNENEECCKIVFIPHFTQTNLGTSLDFIKTKCGVLINSSKDFICVEPLKIEGNQFQHEVKLSELKKLGNISSYDKLFAFAMKDNP